MQDNHISLNHGAGGTVMRDFIRDLFVRHFDNSYLSALDDAARIDVAAGQLLFTTDSYVVQPLVFAGGNIGKLSICGTVNDLAVMGARPLYLSAGFVIEEGFDFALLESIVESMSETARASGVQIVTGDTKVVARGDCDGLFINTSGIGIYPLGHGLCRESVLPGDIVLVSGSVGDHGIAVLSGRNGLSFESDVQSDCAALNHLIENVLVHCDGVKWMRDPTRGGLAAVLSELVESKPVGLLLHETAVPVRKEVSATCEFLGFDPLHLANEGKVVMVVKSHCADDVLNSLKSHPLGSNAAVNGELTNEGIGHVRVETTSGGLRRLRRPAGELLPRIC